MIAVAVVAIATFGGGGAPVRSSDSGAPTTITTVARETITSQTDQSGTLGFAGSHTLSIPTGTQGAELTQDLATLRQDDAKVNADMRSLAAQRKLARPENAETLEAAEATAASDETELAAARAQLTSDRQLGCPAASTATVTTALDGSSSPGGDDGGDGDSGSPENAPKARTRHDPKLAHAAQDGGGSPSSQPQASTGTAAPASTTATLTGTLDPGGLDTTYYFKYGTASSLGSATTRQTLSGDAGASPVQATVSGLTPGTTYEYELLASNSLGSSTGEAVTFQTLESSCVEQSQVVNEDEQAVAEAKDTLAGDKLDAGSSTSEAASQLQSDEQALSQAQQTYSQAQSQQTNPGVRYTALPSDGQVIRRGEAAYYLDAEPVPLFYGNVILYRALELDDRPGADIEMLNRNLLALGYETGVASDRFTSATAAAVRAWQRADGVPATGVVALGDIAIAPGALRVTNVMASDGAAVQPGSPVLQATGLARQVIVQLDAALQSEIAVGDRVSITLPDGATTSGHVSYVGKVASASQSGGTTINLYIAPTHPAATGALDEAPVTVAITTGSASNALVVPVASLLALAGGGYAIEEVLPSGTHQLQAVSTGLFDDASGMVQVAGQGVTPGERIVEASGA